MWGLITRVNCHPNVENLNKRRKEEEEKKEEEEAEEVGIFI